MNRRGRDTGSSTINVQNNTAQKEVTNIVLEPTNPPEEKTKAGD